MSQLRILTEHEVNHNRNKYADMVGKKVSLIAYGKEVTGVVNRIFEDEDRFHLEIHHQAVVVDDEMIEASELFARKIDDWGSLNTVKLI
jgi:hypothetical protein